MKHIKKIGIGLLLAPLISRAQVDQQLLKKYPAHTIAGIQNVIIRGKLPLQKQEELARFYVHQDSLAGLTKLKGGTVEQISQYYSFTPAQLTHLLTPLQLNDYYTSIYGTISADWAKAVKYRLELGLSQKQIDELLKFAVLDNPAGYQSTLQVKNENLKKMRLILTANQFQQYFTVANKDRALWITNDYWTQLKKYTPVHHEDSIKITDQIFKSTLEYYASLDQTSFMHPEKADSIRKRYLFFRPFVLIKLDVYKNTLTGFMQSAAVIAQREKLNLTDTQLDSLLYNDIDLEKRRYANKFHYSNDFINIRSEGIAAMIRILTDEQYTAYLRIRNYNHSLFNADKDWDALKTAGLITPQTDSARVMKENQNYELNWLVADERLSNNRIQDNLFARQRVENLKPEILKKLDAIDSETAANKRLKDSFTW